jgi:hypothetical protein
MKLYTLALPVLLAATGKQCTVTPSTGGTPRGPYGCEDYRAAVEYVCAEDQALRCVPMQYWLEDSFCAAAMDAATPTGVMVAKADCAPDLPTCSEAGTNLKFVLSCVDLSTPCGSLVTSPAFAPELVEVCE